MTTQGQQLADIYVAMLNTHDPDLVDQFVAENYVNHNPFVGDGREANRQFWTGFFAGVPDLRATMEDLVIAGELNLLQMFQQMGALPPLGAGPEARA